MTRKTLLWFVATVAAVTLAAAVPQAGQQAAKPPAPAMASAMKVDPRVATLKTQVMADVNGMYDFGQVMTDMVFSYGELGFQEFETQRYLGGILKENGFTVENGVAGIPTAWVALRRAASWPNSTSATATWRGGNSAPGATTRRKSRNFDIKRRSRCVRH